jgi:hypothetical protein
VDGSFVANSDTLSLTGTTLEIVSEFVNIPSDATKYYVCSIQGDASNYIDVYIANSQLHIDINTADGSYNENIENITVGEYTISIDWSSGVEILINGAYHSYTEVGSIYGFGDDYIGFGNDVYGFSDAGINFATTLDTAYIGVKDSNYFNNVVKEVTY